MTVIGKSYQKFAQNQPWVHDFLPILGLSRSKKTLCSWSVSTFLHLVVEIQPLNIKGQALNIYHKENELYINGKYTAISRELGFSITSILPTKHSI